VEFDSMGCNVLALAPRNCLMVKGNPITKSRLEAAGCKVIEYEGAEISVKGGGGPTCLTRPISRVLLFVQYRLIDCQGIFYLSIYPYL
jgi:arginine deiminase